MKKTIIIILLVMFCVLSGSYFLDPNRLATQKVLVEKGKQTSRDYMLSSLNVTAFARDRQELVWIGTSAGINVYDGKDYIQFSHDTQDTTALPDDYINVLHLDKAGRMWVGTQNGLARYTGAYRFRRFSLPPQAKGSNIVAIEDARPSDLIGDKTPKETAKYAVLVSNGKQTYLVRDDAEVSLSKRKIQPNPLQAPLPDDDFILRKPRELVTATFRDLGDNLWVGYRNAGYQVISQNRIAYQYANRNPLAEATKGRDIVCLQRVGHHILAGSTLRLFIYDTKDNNLEETYYGKMFDLGDGVKPAPKLALNNIVPFDDEHVWLVGNHHVLSCRIDHEQPEVLGHASFGNGVQLGFATKVGRELYVSSQSRYLLRFPFGTAHPDSILVDNPWYDEETQLTTLHSGEVVLFMKDMHIALYSPKSRKVTMLNVSGKPDYNNIDPAFVRQDSYGNIWLGTKRYGLYRLDRTKRYVERVNVPNDVHIQALAEDKQGQLWVTTMRDAFCLQPKTKVMVKNSLVSSRQTQNNWQFFDNAICLSPNGDVVFGSSDGCKFLPPPAMNSNFLSTFVGQHAGRTLGIYSLEVKSDKGKNYAINEQVQGGARYTLSYDENHLKFGFFYPNYSRRSALMYQYMLDGYDHEWRTPTYEHEAEFPDLDPGKYTFRLRLITSPDLPPLQTRNVEVIIQPAPWQSSAAWFLYVCIIGSIIYFINFLYLRERTNRLLLLQEQQEKEREKHTKEMNMSFFANISHEFRNPITIIAGPLLALSSDKSLPAPVRQTLNRVCMSVNRMLRLIDQMLDFNQLETDALRLKVARVDAAEELRRQVAAFEESTKVKGIQLELVMSENEDYQVWMDSDKFEKILGNLFTNALKHTKAGGVIRISAKMQNSALNVSVFNSGEHLAEDKLQDVFKRYYQLADTQSDHHYGWGTGIGLYYVKRLVGLHHGEISVRNVYAVGGSDGKASNGISLDGVEFIFSLPSSATIYNKVEIADHEERVMQIPIEEVKSEEGKVNNEKSVRSVESVCSTQKPKILIVDDDVDVARYIRAIFCDDYIIENRYSAEEALEDLEQIKPDIILSDIIMGEMSGYDFCKTLKSNLMFSHIPVVLITALSNMNQQIDGLRLGAVAYITKPFDPSYLRALVESQLHNVETLRKRLGESTETNTLSAQEADTLSEQDRKFMDELYALMEKRSAEMELNVQTICHDLLISQSKFNYKLKELTGETPGSFFRRYKLNRAAQLLRDGKYNVSEIAMMTGFSTAAHFSVAFKKQFGVSPSEYQ